MTEPHFQIGGAPILVIAGPTATGKTATAIALAKKLNGELVGADSVQVYRHFNVVSAKPTQEELDGVAHHLIDAADANEVLDASVYAQLADTAIRDIHARGKMPIVVGGTGLWLRALLRGLVELPQVDVELRARLTAEGETDGAPKLHARLLSVDPKAANAVHPNDLMRIVRALEVFEQTGEPLGELREKHALGGLRYRAHSFFLDCSWEELDPRIIARTHAMLAAGAVDEVRGLLDRYGKSARPLGAVGYRELVQHILENVPLSETREQIIRSTRIYARRQRTWFRSEPDYTGPVTREELAVKTERLLASTK